MFKKVLINRSLILAVFALLSFLFAITPSSSSEQNKVKLQDVWIQETTPGAKTAVGYATLISKDDDKLVGLTSPRAEKVEMHTMSTENGIMRMRYLPEGIELNANKAVILNPQGAHIMLMNIKGPFKTNDLIPVTFIFSKAASETIKVPVHPISD